MAFPFGGHPTFGQYLVWARDEHGCRAQSGAASTQSGRSHPVTKIVHPNGASVVIPGVSQEDRLEPSKVGYLDRRLGIKSPFFSADEESQEQGDVLRVVPNRSS